MKYLLLSLMIFISACSHIESSSKNDIDTGIELPEEYLGMWHAIGDYSAYKFNKDHTIQTYDLGETVPPIEPLKEYKVIKFSKRDGYDGIYLLVKGNSWVHKGKDWTRHFTEDIFDYELWFLIRKNKTIHKTTREKLLIQKMGCRIDEELWTEYSIKMLQDSLGAEGTCNIKYYSSQITYSPNPQYDLGVAPFILRD